jgi:hypothetical protein
VASLAEQLLQHASRSCSRRRALLQAARTRWDLAQFEFASSGRARAFKKLVHRLGRSAACAPVAAGALGRRRAGGRATWSA